MKVLDASGLLEVLLNRPAAGAVLQAIGGGGTIHAPELIDVEVAQVLRRWALSGEITAVRGRQALDDLSAMPLERHPHLFLIDRVWELRRNLTAYDALYVALAEALDAPLVTRDRRIASVAGLRARIEVV